jgi:hypothetical protein
MTFKILARNSEFATYNKALKLNWNSKSHDTKKQRAKIIKVAVYFLIYIGE